jgi:signal transduction histidine kinase
LYIYRFFEFKGPKWIQLGIFIVPGSFSVLFMLPQYRDMFFQDIIIFNQVHVSPVYTTLGLVPIFYIYVLSAVLLSYFMKTMLSKQNVLKIRVIAFLIATSLFDLTFTLDLFNIYPLEFELTPPLVNIMSVAIAIISSERLYKRDVLPSVFENMMEDIGDLVVVTDNMDRVIYLNKQALEITLEPEPGFLTHYIWDIFPSLTVESGDRIQTLAADGKTYDVQSSNLLDWQNQNRSKVYVLRDVTELVEYQINLEELVEAKSNELMQSERLAAIGETTLMVGHDLRNPLQVLKFLTHELLKMNEIGEEEGRELILKRIDSNVNYMDKIVSDLSMFARTSEPRKKRINLIELVKSCLVKINVPDKVIIDFDFRFDYEVYCDPYMLERVFNNLLLNAIQAMPEGGVITIQASKRDGKDMISVTDSGAGISEQIKEDLFKPLKTTKPKGVGMGLAVCKKLVNLHQGSISVENVADGACFTIEMPEA